MTPSQSFSITRGQSDLLILTEHYTEFCLNAVCLQTMQPIPLLPVYSMPSCIASFLLEFSGQNRCFAVNTVVTFSLRVAVTGANNSSLKATLCSVEFRSEQAAVGTSPSSLENVLLLKSFSFWIASRMAFWTLAFSQNFEALHGGSKRAKRTLSFPIHSHWVFRSRARYLLAEVPRLRKVTQGLVSYQAIARQPLNCSLPRSRIVLWGTFWFENHFRS